MKKIQKIFTIFFLLFFILNICYSQKIETYNNVYDMKYYKAYYNKSIQASSFIIYKLYKGGGNISRSNMSFRSYRSLPHFNYTKSGFDRGHLVPAEDYAYDKNKLKSTFYYINCIPQTTKLNRGVWKKIETDVRKLSQTDSLLIICGGCDYNGLIPKKCFKIVYNLKTKKCVCSLLFNNDNTGFFKTENKLRNKITFTKALKLFYNKS